jgi:hypothetical protein
MDERVIPPECGPDLEPGTICFGKTRCGLRRVGKDGQTYPINKLRFSDDAKEHLVNEREQCMEKRKRKRELFVEDNEGHETYSSHQRARSSESRGLQDDVATDLGRLNDLERMDDGGNGDLGDTEEKSGQFGNQDTLSMTEPGTMFEALKVGVDEKTNLDDGVDDNETETDEPEDENTTTFRMKMIRFKKKFEQLLDEGFCNGVDSDLCIGAQQDLDEILDEYVW